MEFAPWDLEVISFGNSELPILCDPPWPPHRALTALPPSLSGKEMPGEKDWDPADKGWETPGFRWPANTGFRCTT